MGLHDQAAKVGTLKALDQLTGPATMSVGGCLGRGEDRPVRPDG
jgi:hypothetical protein